MVLTNTFNLGSHAMDFVSPIGAEQTFICPLKFSFYFLFRHFIISIFIFPFWIYFVTIRVIYLVVYMFGISRVYKYLCSWPWDFGWWILKFCLNFVTRNLLWVLTLTSLCWFWHFHPTAWCQWVGPTTKSMPYFSYSFPIIDDLF